MTRKCSDLLVAKGRTGLAVSGVTTDIISDFLDTLRANDADSAEIENILWLKIAVVFWDAAKKENGHVLDIKRIGKTLCAALLRHFHIMQNPTNFNL